MEELCMKTPEGFYPNRINRNHKDRLFIRLFGSGEYKENLLALYNALNDTEYTNIDDLQINTIDDVIYMGYKNDVSFLLYSEMDLFEHMSSYNPNMPLRGLMYFAKLIEKYITQGDFDIYGTKLLKIPEPRYYIFYNGEKDFPDETVLRLSDAFQQKKAPGECEWTAHMLNVNYGKNKKLLEKCKTLEEYAILIDTIREKRKTAETMEEAVDLAVNECIKEGVLEKFLTAHKAEVCGMLLEEFDEEKYLKTVEARGREEGIQIGKEEGVQIGREEGIQIGEARGKELGEKLGKITTAQKLLENHVDWQVILASTGLTEEELKKIEQGQG